MSGGSATGLETCPVCHGEKTLKFEDEDPETCWGCLGAGEVPEVVAPPPEPESDPNACLICGETLPEPPAFLGHMLDKHGDALRQGASAEDPSTQPDAPEPPAQEPPKPRRRRGRVAEGKPWDPHNTDGNLNLGSYAVGAALGTVEWAHGLIARHNLEVAREDGVPFEVPKLPQVKALARHLLRAADRAQARVRADGHVDRMANSHTRARGAVRTVIDAVPVPWGAAAPEIEAWVDELAEGATGLLITAIALVDAEPPD